MQYDNINKLISRRVFLVGLGKLSLLSILAAKMGYMQLIKNEEYKILSNKNCINLIPILPIRGSIVDIRGKFVAINKRCFRLIINKEKSKRCQKELASIVKLLKLSNEEKQILVKRVHSANLHDSIVVINKLSWKQISLIEEQKPYFKFIFIIVFYSRFYPLEYSLSHLLGYIKQLDKKEKQELNLNFKYQDLYVGKAGLEKYYENSLRGVLGYKKVEVNALGYCVKEIARVDSVSGINIHLNIDSSLQEKVYQYSKQKCSSVIVMDCNNGNILVILSTPTFNPNSFNKLSKDDWNSLLNNPYKPLINRAIQSAYPAGSVFKIITALAALENGISPLRTFNCKGHSIIKSNNFRCNRKEGHGFLDMIGAIKHSCNSYIYELARIIGPDAIIDVAKKFGFGKLTMIDLPGESAGFIPSKKWKEKKLGSKWTIGDTLNLSIGQGFLLVTPIQLIRFTSAIANNGILYTPKIVKNNSSSSKINIKEEHLILLREAMYQVVNVPGGTAYSSRIIYKNQQIAGKTGTIQVQAKSHAKDDLSKESISWIKRNHSLFVGFGPYNQPKYSILVFVEHGGDGSKLAAPIASKIMQEVFIKYLI